MTRPPRLAWIAWLVVCVVWGTTYLGIRIALETIPPALMAGFRWTAAGLILAVILTLRGERLPGPRAWPGIALLSLLMIGFGNGFVVWAEQYVPSGLTAVVIATSPFWMMSAEALLGGERLTRRGLAGLAIGFFGIVLLVWPDLRAGGARAAYFGAGLVALQLACAGWAAGSSWSKRHAIVGSVVGSTALQMLYGGILMLVVGTIAGEWHGLSFNARTFGALVYLTLAGSLAAFVAYIYALRHLPISTVSLYAYVNPVIAVVLGAMLLGEPFGVRVILAAALVLSGLAVVRSGGVRGSTSRAATARDASAPLSAARPLSACGPQPRQARS